MELKQLAALIKSYELEIKILKKKQDELFRRISMLERNTRINAVGKRFHEDEELACPSEPDYFKLDDYDPDHYKPSPVKSSRLVATNPSGKKQ